MLLKKILFVIFIGITFKSMAQQGNDLLNDWKKVEAFESKGLTKSALTQVLTIYEKAIKSNNDAQQIKSCMYQIKYRNILQEDSYENNIFFVDSLIDKAKTPAKNILQSMQAQLFWQYLQNNRYKFYDRTKLKEEKSKDISTWSIDKIHSVIGKLYKASLQNEAVLKSTKLDAFAPIIIKGENTSQLRPTLFDFIAHRALSYFVTDENQLTKPAYQFKINDAKSFAPVAEFVSASFKTKDSTSLQHQAILLLQNILQFHLIDKNIEDLIDADLIRLNFVNQYGIFENKEKLFEASLKKMEEQYASNSSVAQAAYLRAQIYYTRGQQFIPNAKQENQYEIKRAKELCENTEKKYPKSEGAINCHNLINQINQPTLSLQTEQVNIPNQPFRCLVNYKNSKKIFLRLIKTNREALKKIERKENDKYWLAFTNLKYEKKWEVNLPDLQDYQNHTTEIKIDGTDEGTYIVLASLSEDFSLQKNIIAKQLIYVSNISYIFNNNNEYYVLHRDNGKPLANTQVQTWENKYNYQNSKYEIEKAEKYTADKNGFFKLKQSVDYKTVLLQLNYNGKELFMDDEHYANVYTNFEQNLRPSTFLFTDRSIYRPGQLIYFKGIIVQQNKDAAKSAVLPNFKTTVVLKDANGQKVTSLAVTTNEYGSYNGSFTLPQGLLNGQFFLQDSVTNSQNYFSVEEYKRPKFFVEIKKPNGTYRLNDSIKITGNAKAYAGNNIDGAKVKYRVVRKIQYPIWCYWMYRRGGYPFGRNEQMEITNGEAVTNSRGEFNVTFKALPDESVDKKNQPTFFYEVSADVTDINGESRSGNTTVAVAYQTLQLNINTADKILGEEVNKIKIESTNLNNIFEKAKVTVTITKIKSPEKIYRERYWEMPDQFVMSKDEYTNYFPYDVYKDENEIKAWPLQDKVFDKTDTTKESLVFNFENKIFDAGWYKIVATTKDKYGEDVRAEKFVQLISNNQSQKTNAQPIAVQVKKQSVEPGEKVEYNITTSFDDIWLIHNFSKMDKTNTISYKAIGKSQPLAIAEAVAESDRGGMAMTYAFVQHNRVYKGGENFDVAWSNKDLNITFNTFRDKLLPGQKEKYSIKITGNKGEKIAAEMLASMYDASLDQFKTHNLSKLNIWPTLYNTITWNENGFTKIESEENSKIEYDYISQPNKTYDRLGSYRTNKQAEEFWAGDIGRYRGYDLEGKVSGVVIRGQATMTAPAAMMEQADSQLSKVVVTGAFKNKDSDKVVEKKAINLEPKAAEAPQQPTEQPVQVRKNFNETAFFYPDLKTDEEGNISFEYTIPEALTQWKLMTLVHTKNAASGYIEKNVVTQKPLMVQPNAPRFLREGDQMEFSAKVVNLSEKEVTGTAQLELLDAATNKPVDGWFKNIFPTQYFTVAAGQSFAIKFPMEVPFNFNSAVTYRIIAKTTNASDGEEMALPVLTNRMLVTESMPINMRNTNSKTFKFQKLINSASSNSIKNHALTVEYTSNPAWYAVQALPYLMEYPYECAEQTFNRYYANALASFIANSNPKIKNVFEKWKTLDTAALQSNLEKNQELKSVLLQETPWVMDAQNENQQKKNLALLFDMVKMSSEKNKAFSKLKEMQSSNGGFVWFKGGPDDRYITQYIITGIGHLRKLNALTAENYVEVKSVVDKAIVYLDKKLKEDYNDLLRYKSNLKENNLSQVQIQYLYMRSFFSEYKIADASQIAYNYYRGQAQKYWLSNSKYAQAMIALALHRSNEPIVAKAIIKSLKENAIVKDEMGMYWKEWSTGGYYWYQAPIESQAMMVEAFTDIDKNETTIDDLKTWLLKQKQTQNWKTTKATAEACYALLLGGSNWLNAEKEVTINVGISSIKSTDDALQAGTGYFKKRIEADKVKSDMGNISVSIVSSVNSSVTSWGSVYWQYFEDLDKITEAETPLKLKKQLYVEKNTSTGPTLVAIADGAQLKIGDKVKVRIELKVDRDMEYVHMKDMRAACMEPVNVISEYKYQGGLGYYESTKDASTNFFFGYLNRGTYIFEYPMFVTHAGNFSNGITSIQCMYAPEFTSHSEGIRVNIEQ
jgi:uncharacterized protein YfaS (alpha-2-macroglobulin family)